jgi:hypothetical protein
MGKNYAITEGKVFSYEQIAKILSMVVGKKISYVHISYEDARKSMKSMGMGDWLIDDMVKSYSAGGSGHASLTTNTVEQIKVQKPNFFYYLQRITLNFLDDISN